MQDAKGRYYYLKGTFTSFNISETIPTGDDVAAIFTVTIGADNKATIVNVGKNATLAYSIQHNSIGVYADVTDATKYALPTLYVDKTSRLPLPASTVYSLKKTLLLNTTTSRACA